MATALEKSALLKPEIRLGRAIADFEAILPSEQRTALHGTKCRLQSSPPEQKDVMRLVSDMDKTSGVVVGKRCYGPRFTNFLEAVQRFAALGDVVVGGSQNIAACGVWALVRMTVLSIASYSAYLDKLSSLFMTIGRSAPTQQALGLLYPQSKRLQTCFTEYYVVVVQFCRHIWTFVQKSAIQRYVTTLSGSELNQFKSDLEQWARDIKEEVDLMEVRDIVDLKSIVRRENSSAAHRRRLQQRLRILNLCSTYNQSTIWKQTRKLGTSSLVARCVEYATWTCQPGPSSIVFVGKLGCGKSVLMASIVNDLVSSTPAEQTPVAYFFCRHDVPESLKARTILGSLIRQLLESIKDFEVAKTIPVETVLEMDSDDLQNLVEHTFPGDKSAYFVLDGIDECDLAVMEDILEQLQRLQKSIKLKLCISIRLDPSKKESLGLKGLGNVTTVNMSDNNPDIDGYVRAELESRIESGKLKLGDPTIILDIAEQLTAGSQGMFLWVALQLETLCAMQTDEAIRQALDDLPRDLSETFARILARAGQGHSSYQMPILALITAAFRPLTTEEIREALSVTPGDTDWRPSSLLNEVASALACCGSVIIMDEEEQTVRLVHHSFKQFLFEKWKLVGNVQFTPELAHKTVAEITVTYLNYGVFSTQLSTKVAPRVVVGSAPSQIISSTMSSSTKRNVAIKLLARWKSPDIDLGKTLLETTSSPLSQSIQDFCFFTYARSYCISHVVHTSALNLALTHLFVRLLDGNGVQLNIVGEDSLRLLLNAAKTGNDALVGALVATDKVDVKATDSNGRTALICAAGNGHHTAVIVLIETGKAEVEAVDNSGQTALMCAAGHGHSDVVRALIGTGKAKVEAVDKYGRTALMCAAENGYSDAVKVLIEIGKAKVEAVDDNGQTALMCAAENAYSEVARVLIETGKAKVEAVDSYGRTALICAAENAHSDVARVLIETGKAEVEATDSVGRTALTRASQNGHSDVVRALIGTGKAKVEAVDKYGRTALMCAAENGYSDAVKVLIEIGKAKVEAVDDNGQTALMCAAENAHSDVARVLIETGKAEVEATDSVGRTALTWAAQSGHSDTVRVLIEIGKAKVEAVDDNGQTALMCAAESGQSAASKVLIEIGKAKVGAVDDNGRTALIWAAESGHADVVKELIETGEAKVEHVELYGRTALIWAAQNGHSDVVKALIETGKAKVEAVDSYGRTALIWAAQNGHSDAVKVLIEAGKAKVEATDSIGRTALICAAQNGCLDVLTVLIGTGKAKVNTVERYSRTALICAAQNGHSDVVEELLKTGKAKVEAVDNYGRTALGWAAQNRHSDAVKVLNEMGKVEVEVEVEVEAVDTHSWTPVDAEVGAAHFAGNDR